MHTQSFRLAPLMLVAALGLAIPTVHPADKSQPKAPKPENSREKNLASQQDAAGRKYQQFEKILLQMAEALRSADPDRAAVLLKAISQSKEDLIELQFDQLIELLGQGKLSSALKGQNYLRDDLTSILQLLLSSERDKQLKEKIEKLKAQLRELNRIIADQKRLRGETEFGFGNKGDLSLRQRKLERRSHRLSRDIGEEDKKGSDNKDKSDGGQQGKQGKQGGQQGQQGQQGGQQDKQPGQKEVDEASEDMKSARKDIDEKKRDDATKDQAEAISKLEQARRELEEILKQLREEERDVLLADIETRLRKMLSIQKIINQGTIRLDKIETAKRTRSDELRSVELSRKEKELVKQANAALAVLKEEGSAVAFPEALTEVREDMKTVTNLLARADTGEFTQSVEKDIVTTLEEMVEALQKEQQNKSKPSKSSPNCTPQAPPLIEMLAELKMIRSLQLRVNRRTKKIDKLIKPLKTLKPAHKKAIEDLSKREGRIVDVTEILATGRNR